MRWILVVLILSIAISLAACEPNYVQQKDLKPTSGAIAIEAASQTITALVIENEANVAQLESQLDSSEEQLTFDVVSAKRQLVGSTASTRQDTSDLIDVQEHNGLSEIDRARSRLHAYEAASNSVAVSALKNLSAMDPASFDPTQGAQLISEVRSATNTSGISSVIGKAQSQAVTSSQAIEQALQNVRSLQTGLSSTS